MLTLLVAFSLLIGPPLASGAPRPKPTPTPTPGPACTLVPLLRDVTINQGLGSYQPLVRGKETLVRPFLSLPSCAGTGSSIAVTGGSLRVAAGSTVLATAIAPTPAPVSPYPQVATFGTAALIDTPADLKFVVPGAVWNHPATADAYIASLSVTINHQSKASSTATPVSGSTTYTATFNPVTGTTTPVTASVDRRTGGLRILAVPMGDAREAYSTWFSSKAQQAVQNGMQTLARLFPVPDGIASLTSASGGVRYSINPTLLDIGSLLTNGTWCGTGANFDEIKDRLAQFRLSWNTANPAATADVVVGVIDAAKSSGISAGCAEGMASVVSPEAWVRAIPDASRTPSMTGALLGMEVGHALGLVPAARDDFYSPFHSPNVVADGTAPNRGYNIPLRSVMSGPKSALTLSTGWNNATVLVERDDYAFLRCRLGGGTTTDCPTTGTVGTVVGIGAEPSFVISGTTDGTTAGTHVLESYFAMGVARTDASPTSAYRLVQLQGTSVLRTDGIPVSFTDSLHDDDDAVAVTPQALIAASVPFNTSATRIELRNGSTVLYARNRGEPPVIIDSNIVPGGLIENFTDSESVDDAQPALTRDDAWLAWTNLGIESSVVYVAPAADADAAVPLQEGPEDPIQSYDPAWCGDGSALAYVSNGSLFTIDVDLASESVTFGSPALVYAGDFYDGSVGHPTWSPDCARIAFEDQGDIWVIDADGNLESLEQLTDDGFSHAPSWSQADGDDRIVFARDSATAGIGTVLASLVTPRENGPIAPADHAGTQFTVNAADDNDDLACDAVHCSLREAINAANELVGRDAIHFAIGTGPVTIQPATGLPTITDAVVIDATTQPGFDSAPIVELDGQLTDNTAFGGLYLAADDSEIRGLVINRFVNRSILLENGTRNVIAGNYLGLNGAGDAGFAGSNAFGGIELRTNAPDNVIGGPGAADRNVVWRGVWIRTAASSGNEVVNNYVGLDATGAAATLGVFGIQVDRAPGTLITGNVVASVGVGIGVSGATANDTIIRGNRLGTDATGTTAIANSNTGIQIQDGARTQVGGPAPADANLASGHTGRGITIIAGATATVVRGNLVGVDVTGQLALGNGANGILNTATGTLIRDNVVSGNALTSNAAAVELTGAGAVVVGNLIGTDADGIDPIPNGANGIGIQSTTESADGNVIGGSGAGEPNLIANNGRDGIALTSLSGQGNVIRSNVIRDNARLGINLGDDLVTANDAGDVDTGPNDRQNYPVLTSATMSGAEIEIAGDLDGAASTTYVVEYFGNTACDGSGFGEGETFIGVASIGTDASGQVTFSSTFPETAVGAGSFITATATDPAGNTSEFSACVEAASGPVGPMVVNASDDVDDGNCDAAHCSLREAILAAALAGSTEIQFAIPGAGPHTIAVGTPLPGVADLTIDGGTQPGYDGAPLIELDGGGLVDDPEGFEYGLMMSGNATVRGLAIGGFVDGGVIMWVADGNVLESSYIGLRVDGDTVHGNGGPGIQILDSSGNTIGGPGAGNVIGDNGDYGIQINSQSADNVFRGNLIGLNAAGDAGRGNGIYGIYVVDSPRNIIGGAVAGEGNVISDHLTGIRLLDLGGGGTGGTVIEGNRIGTDVSGLGAIPNQAGINISASDNTVGGTAEGAGNMISGNEQAGIEIVQFEGQLITGNEVLGNLIGVGTDGIALGNGSGIRIDASQSLIGGSIAGEENVIANNVGNGVSVVRFAGMDAHSNSILGNAIHDNGGLGIDLGEDGVTANDPLDADAGANRLQNFPAIVTATSDGTATEVELEMSSSQSAPFDIELFANDACGPASGQGEALVDRFEIITNADGFGAAVVTLGGDYAGQYLSATATNASGDTSEFSACALVDDGGDGGSGFTDLYLLSADAGIGSDELLVTDGSFPSFGRQDEIAFARDGAIWTIGADGLSSSAIADTGPADGRPAMSGTALAFQRSIPTGVESSQSDIMLIRAEQTLHVSAQVTIGADARFDVFFDCGGPFFPVAVGLRPDVINSDGTVRLVYSYDSSLSCGDGAPRLTTTVSDGFLRSGFATQAQSVVNSEPKPPVAAVSAPLDGGEILQFGVIPLRGTVKDAEDGELSGAAVQWSIGGPAGNVPASPGVGTTIDLKPPSGGWAVGTYTATLSGTDTDGNAADASVEFEILADADHDGIPARVEDAAGSCLGPDGDNNPFNAFGDPDGDGIPTSDDLLTGGGPCVPESSYRAYADFDPDTFYVPAKGKHVTVTIRVPYRSLADVDPASVRIVAVGGASFSLANVGWSIAGDVATARFDRQQLARRFQNEGMLGHSITITVGGTSRAGVSPAWSFTATDSTNVTAN